jgi:predicted transcriptional regulator of viral defense system
MKTEKQILEFANKHGIIRPSDINSSDKIRQQFIRMYKQGKLERVGRGLYALPDKISSEFMSFAQVSKLAPQGIICLISALQFHELTTQISPEIWLMLEGATKKPSFEYPPTRVMHTSGKAFNYGIGTYHIDKVPVKIYTPAKTVADCFKFRNKIGIDVALEALQETFRSRKATPDEIWEAAKVCRVSNIIRPYMEAVI